MVNIQGHSMLVHGKKWWPTHSVFDRLLVAESWVTIFELFSLWGHVSVLFFMIEKENSTPCFPQIGFQGLNGFKVFYNLWILVLRVPKYIFISYSLWWHSSLVGRLSSRFRLPSSHLQPSPPQLEQQRGLY